MNVICFRIKQVAGNPEAQRRPVVLPRHIVLQPIWMQKKWLKSDSTKIDTFWFDILLTDPAHPDDADLGILGIATEISDLNAILGELW